MATKTKRWFFTNHKKSSALLVSVAIHVLFIVVALSFVAVSVITKSEVDFEAREVNRPRMNLRKLQVPVNVKKPPQQPKLRKQIVVKPKFNQITPDFKMPEIVGVKGGVGAGGSTFGAGATLGFSMPELNLFGVKSKGEKVFIILDSTPEMMYDSMGGIPAYTIIKQEVVKVLSRLPSTTLFNIAVYDETRTVTLFPGMVQANEENTARVEQWLKPLNAVTPGMGSKEWGIRTIGKGGDRNKEQFDAGKVERERFWYPAAGLAMKQQADTIFVLTCQWGNLWHTVEGVDRSDWYESSAGKRWKEAYVENKKKLEEENRKRAADGRPPMVVEDNPGDINRVFSPDIERPPSSTKYRYTPKDMVEALLEIRNRFRPVEKLAKLGIQRNTSASKVDFSLNVVHFRPVDAGGQQDEKFRQLTNFCDGEYRTIEGLEAIKRSVE